MKGRSCVQSYKTFLCFGMVEASVLQSRKRRHDTQYNDTQGNYIQRNDIQQNSINQNDSHNGTQQNSINQNDSHNRTQRDDTKHIVIYNNKTLWHSA